MTQRQSSHGLENQGLSGYGETYWNLAAPALYKQALCRGEAEVADGGPLVALTGQHTGRSPNDKFTVKEPSSDANIWWGDVNRPISPEHFDAVFAKVQQHMKGRDLFIQDCYAGADSEYRLKVRIVTEQAWHSLFVRNMFIQPE